MADEGGGEGKGSSGVKFSMSIMMPRTNQWFIAGCELAAVLMVSGCAAHYASTAVADPYGFFSGVWHGIVFPYATITNVLSWLLSLAGISLLQDIQIIGRPNTGLPYYVGLVLGLCTYGGAGASYS